MLHQNTGSLVPKVNVFDLPELMQQTFEPLRWTVKGILPEGCVIFAGRPKIGKSLFALQLALSVATGGQALEQVDVEQSDVLYLALEETRRRLQSRIKHLLGDCPIPAGLRMATNWPTIDEGGAEALEHWLENHPATRLVIVDTFRKIKSRKRGGEYDSLTKLADLSKKFGICLLIVHHTRKADADDAFDTISGSTETASVADAMLVLKRSRYCDYAELNITGRDIEEDKIALRFYEDTLTWEILGNADIVLMSETRKDILRVLREAEDSMTPREIADCLEINPATIRQALSRMVRDKQIERSYTPGHYLAPTDKASLAKEKALDKEEEEDYLFVNPIRTLVTLIRQKGIKKALEELGFVVGDLTAPENYMELI
ncbi:MAG TPA: AAA family ATPase [Blastocatellia bacterium]|nr:AAA family ATPase [Blastocatellia bacterium]